MIETLKTLIQKKDIDELIKLIKDNPGVLDQKDKDGSSGFLLTAYCGMPEVFEAAKEHKRHFSFHDAILSGKNDLVDMYLKQNTSMVNDFSNDGFTPLSLASFFNQTEIAKKLLHQGADPNMQAINPSRVNALHAAVAKENVELCKLFLENGADVNVTQTQQVTPLHSAAHKGNLALVKLLIEHGANVDDSMENGETAISLAKKDKHQDVVKYLEKVV